MTTSDFGGYQTKIFVNKPPKMCECPLCFEILKNPRQCSNGHCFCLTCITSAAKRSLECPICKVEFALSSLNKNLIVQQFVEDLEVFCISCDDLDNNLTKSCTWKGPLHHRQNHFENECDYYPVKCGNKCCEEHIMRHSVSEHNNVCQFSTVTCEHCHQHNNLTLMRAEYNAHLQSCEYRPVACPNNCSVIVAFNNITMHLENDCPKSIVYCPLLSVGLCQNCPMKAEKSVILQHIMGGNDALNTIARCVTPFQKMQTDNNNLNEEIKELKQQLSFAHMQIKQLKDELSVAQHAKRADPDCTSQHLSATSNTNDNSELLMETNIQNLIDTIAADVMDINERNCASAVGLRTMQNDEDDRTVSEYVVGNKSEAGGATTLLSATTPGTMITSLVASKSVKKNHKKAERRKKNAAFDSAVHIHTYHSYSKTGIITQDEYLELYRAIQQNRTGFTKHYDYCGVIYNVLQRLHSKWDTDSPPGYKDTTDFMAFSSPYFLKCTTEQFCEAMEFIVATANEYSVFDQISVDNHDRLLFFSKFLQDILEDFSHRFLPWFTEKVRVQGGLFMELDGFMEYNRAYNLKNWDFASLISEMTVTVSGAGVTIFNGHYAYYRRIGYENSLIIYRLIGRDDIFLKCEYVNNVRFWILLQCTDGEDSLVTGGNLWDKPHHYFTSTQSEEELYPSKHAVWKSGPNAVEQSNMQSNMPTVLFAYCE